MIARQYLNVSLDTLFDRLWAPSAPYSHQFMTKKLGMSNISSKGWTKDNLIVNYTAPVVGIPFCSSTNITQSLKIIEKSKNRLIIESESITHDAPYCDTFTCQEVWIVL